MARTVERIGAEAEDNRVNRTYCQADDCFIHAQVDLDVARQRLARRSWWRVRAVWRAILHPFAQNRPTDTPRHIELIWLPRYHVVFQLQASGDDPVTIDVLIDGSDRRATFWDLTSIQWEPRNGREQFAPALNEDTVRDIARRALFQAGLRGKSWRHGLKTWEIQTTRVVHYPYWVAYFERRNRRLDVVMVDAVTSDLAGPAGKIALLAALDS